MLFFVQYKGKEVAVRVESRQDKLYVKMGDAPEKEVDMVFLGNDCSFLADNAVFHANVTTTKDSSTVWRPMGNIDLKVESEYKRIVNMLRGQQFLDENNVYAKMPGKIVKILTKPGELVDKGTPIMVMEAMKMENEIRSNTKAEVTSIKVNEGQAVETGALLIEMKPVEE